MPSTIFSSTETSRTSTPVPQEQLGKRKCLRKLLSSQLLTVIAVVLTVLSALSLAKPIVADQIYCDNPNDFDCKPCPVNGICRGGRLVECVEGSEKVSGICVAPGSVEEWALENRVFMPAMIDEYGLKTLGQLREMWLKLMADNTTQLELSVNMSDNYEVINGEIRKKETTNKDQEQKSEEIANEISDKQEKQDDDEEDDEEDESETLTDDIKIGMKKVLNGVKERLERVNDALDEAYDGKPRKLGPWREHLAKKYSTKVVELIEGEPKLTTLSELSEKWKKAINEQVTARHLRVALMLSDRYRLRGKAIVKRFSDVCLDILFSLLLASSVAFLSFSVYVRTHK